MALRIVLLILLVLTLVTMCTPSMVPDSRAESSLKPFYALTFGMTVYSIDTQNGILYSTSFLSDVSTTQSIDQINAGVPAQNFNGYWQFPDGRTTGGIGGAPIIANVSGRNVTTGYFVKSVINTDPSAGVNPYAWKLDIIRPLGLAFPSDTFELDFLYVLNGSMSFNFSTPYVSLPLNVQAQWQVHAFAQKLSAPPTNATLEQWEMNTTYYPLFHSNLPWTYYRVALDFTLRQSGEAQAILFSILPGIALITVLTFSFVQAYRRRIGLSAALTVFFGASIFAIPFTISFEQQTIESVPSVQEVFYLGIFIFAAVFTVYSLFRLRDPDASGGKQPTQEVSTVPE